jgi:DNA-binding XRE family transcriptional regulator
MGKQACAQALQNALHMKTLGEQVKAFRDERGWNSTEMAKAVGTSRQNIESLEEHGNRIPKYLGALAAAMGRPVDQMLALAGLSPAVGQHTASEPSTKFGTPRVVTEDDLTIPQYASGGAMGNGLVLEEKQPGVIKSWRVDHEWLRLNVRHHTGVQNLCIVTGFGPSMKPKYNPGDPLLLDRGVTTVETEGIYFFRVGQHGFIKQLQRIPTEDGMIIRAKSLNENYDPFDITAKMDFEVFGKVLTVWKSEQV